ncbi:hypothetical protein EON82_07985 [bacterium]|nr:MAG: hypothetical protein EON82_07985 [bacterium]
MLILAGLKSGVPMRTEVRAPLELAETRPVKIVYYHPSDLPPFPGYEARLNKTLRYVENWYAENMAKNGFGRMTFRMDRDATGKLNIVYAKGELPLASHGREKREATESIHRIVREAGKAAGYDPDKETVLVVSNMLVWKDGKTTEVGPFYGSGSTRSGECWVFDDPMIDPDRIPSKEPGGWYGDRAISIGKFNTTYIGGIAHELGHCFGLPHEGETPEEHETKGTGIMGPGNHTFMEQLRGEGRGTFMTMATAFPLSLHPCFVPGKPAAAPDGRTLSIADLKVDKVDRGALEITGRITATPAVVGIVGYDDPDSRNDDDSHTAVVKPRADGSFSLRLPPPVPGRGSGQYSLRLSFYHADGEPTRRAASFRRETDMSAPLASITEQLQQPRTRRRG